MSNTVQLTDRLAASLYLAAGARRDCCAGCRSADVITYERGQNATSLACRQHKGAIVSKLAICAKWQEKQERRATA